MPTTDRILDWPTIAAAGIDTTRVERETNPLDESLETYRIVSRDGSTSLVFGEYYDRSEGGWDSLLFERIDTGDEWRWESMEAPDGYETAEEVLAAVKAWADAN